MLAHAPMPDHSAFESRLLDLFAPAFAHGAGAISGQTANASLWRLDAIHRAKNLAQMSRSVAHLIEREPERWANNQLYTSWGFGAHADARALARAYEILGLDGTGSPCPCLGIIADVAVRLTQTFGRARNIAISVGGQDVLVSPETRRALALMCSELIINALKYAFPADGPGRISVTLGEGPEGIALVVEDDGAGLPADYSPGHGGKLLDRLAALSGATMTRTVGKGRSGLRVSVRIEGTGSLKQSSGQYV